MMWVFAIVLVLALGGIAAVAVGRGDPLADAYVDRPDALLPARGPIGGRDLRTVRFPLVLRGYRMADVDALLDRLATQLDAAQASEPLPEPVSEPAPEPVPEPVPEDMRSAEPEDRA